MVPELNLCMPKVCDVSPSHGEPGSHWNHSLSVAMWQMSNCYNLDLGHMIQAKKKVAIPHLFSSALWHYEELEVS